MASSEIVYGEARKQKEFLLASYMEHLKTRGVLYDEWDLVHSVGARKPLAPLFNKTFDIPLIDDSRMATDRPFPGILGITFKPFLSEREKEMGLRSEYGVTAPEAVAAVRNYYTSLTV